MGNHIPNAGKRVSVLHVDFRSFCTIQPARNGSTDSISGPPSLVIRTKLIPLSLGNPTEKSYNGLVKIAFESLTLACNSASSLSPEHLSLCISTLGQFGHQADMNIALTAAASLHRSVSDVIQSKWKNVDEELEYSEFWMFLLLEVLGLCTDPRAEVRDGGQFRTMQLYGATWSSKTWGTGYWKPLVPHVHVRPLPSLPSHQRLTLRLPSSHSSSSAIFERDIRAIVLPRPQRALPPPQPQPPPPLVQPPPSVKPTAYSPPQRHRDLRAVRALRA